MEGTAEGAPCAKIELVRTMRPPRRPFVVRAVSSLRTRGVAGSARRAAEAARLIERPVPPPRPKRRWPQRDDEALGLKPGDVVEVKSAEEVRETLDADDMYKGLYFMGEMWKYCGRRMVVRKRIDRIMSETTGELHTGIRNTVLLEDACCDGAAHEGCGANCFHLWREVWLRRPDGE